MNDRKDKIKPGEFDPWAEQARLDNQLSRKPHEDGLSQEGMGSTNEEDDMKERTAPRVITEERVSAGRTWFDADEEDGGEWNRRKRWDDGEGRSDWKAEKNKQDYLKDLRCWASKLKLTRKQTEDAERLLKQIDMSKSGTLSSESMILAVITLVVNRDNRLIREEDTFKKIRGGVGVSPKELRNARNQIRDRHRRYKKLYQEMIQPAEEKTPNLYDEALEKAGFVPDEVTREEIVNILTK